MNTTSRDYAEKLAALLSRARNNEELTNLLMDLLTTTERKDLWERWRIVDLLLQGHSQREIKEKLSISISKVTRGSQVLQKGTGAFMKIWKPA